MRNIILFLSVLYSCIVFGQGELLSVSAKVDLTKSVIDVEQVLKLDLPDSIQSIDIKNLHFEGTQIIFNSAIVGGNKLSVKEISSDGLTHLELTSNGKPLKEVLLNFKAEVQQGVFYLPLFFTNMSAASSENDFFKMTMKINTTEDYIIHFPNVDVTETITETIKTVSLEAPALPSVIRMELISKDEEKGLEFLDLVDWLVAFIFGVIGVLIWKNRKRLMHG